MKGIISRVFIFAFGIYQIRENKNPGKFQYSDKMKQIGRSKNYIVIKFWFMILNTLCTIVTIK